MALLGNVRGERLAQYFDGLLQPTLRAQRLTWRPPYDSVAMAAALLELRTEVDAVFFSVPADDSEEAARAGQLARPDLAVNCLKQQRYADLASIREIRLAMPVDGRVLTHTPLPTLAGDGSSHCQTFLLDGQTYDELRFRIDTDDHEYIIYCPEWCGVRPITFASDSRGTIDASRGRDGTWDDRRTTAGELARLDAGRATSRGIAPRRFTESRRRDHGNLTARVEVAGLRHNPPSWGTKHYLVGVHDFWVSRSDERFAVR